MLKFWVQATNYNKKEYLISILGPILLVIYVNNNCLTEKYSYSVLLLFFVNNFNVVILTVTMYILFQFTQC